MLFHFFRMHAPLGLFCFVGNSCSFKYRQSQFLHCLSRSGDGLHLPLPQLLCCASSVLSFSQQRAEKYTEMYASDLKIRSFGYFGPLDFCVCPTVSSWFLRCNV